MKLGGKIPVESLDDIRLQNIERRVVSGAGDALASGGARAPRGGFGLAFAAVALIAIVLAGIGGWTLRGRTTGTVATLDAIKPITVATGAEGSTLDIGDAVIQSNPATAFTITRPDGKVLVAMTRGKVELEVAKRANRPPLIVRAGDTDVIVVGTHFTVDFGDGTGDVQVAVTEGVVRVDRKHVESRVAAGQAWTSKGGSAGGTVVAIGETSTQAGAGGSGMVIDYGLKDRQAVVPDVRVPGQVTHRKPNAGSGGDEGSGEDAGSNEPVNPGLGQQVGVLQDPNDPDAAVKAMILRQPVVAAMNVGTVDGTRAMAKYREILTTQKGDDAAFAMYSMAVTQHQKLGRHTDALSTLESYFRRFNDGPYHVPALWLKVRIACRNKIDAQCKAAAEAFKRKGDGVPAEVAERILLQPETAE